MKLKFVLMVLIVFASVTMLFAVNNDNAIGRLGSGASDLCNSAQNLLKVGIVLMVILGAATYALGQVLSSEIRARATVWATSMFMAALFAAVIYVLVPYIISFILQEGQGEGTGCDMFCSTSGGGGSGGPGYYGGVGGNRIPHHNPIQ